MPQIRVKSAEMAEREAQMPQIRVEGAVVRKENRIIAHQLRLVDILTPCINAGGF